MHKQTLMTSMNTNNKKNNKQLNEMYANHQSQIMSKYFNDFTNNAKVHLLHTFERNFDIYKYIYLYKTNRKPIYIITFLALFDQELNIKFLSWG